MSVTFPLSQTIMVDLPRSKSMLARKLCMDFIAGRTVRVTDDCDDICHLSRALHTLAEKKVCMLRAGESATALRFLTAISAALPDTTTVIEADAPLRRRPVAPLVEALRSVGASITYLEQEGHAPLLIKGRQLQGGTVDFTGTGSSQYASACVLISPMTLSGIEVIKHDAASMPYLNLTRHMVLHPHTRIEADWSAAAFMYELTAITGRPIHMPHLRVFGKSLQGDARAMCIFSEILNVRTTPLRDALLIQRDEQDAAQQPEPATIDMSMTPDLVPPVAMAMAMRGRPGILTGLKNLRIKESNRLESVTKTIAAMGGHVKVTHESSDYQLHILGQPTAGATPEITVDSYGDHRIAMCAAAAMFTPHLSGKKIQITHIDCIRKSFPGFMEIIQRDFKPPFSD